MSELKPSWLINMVNTIFWCPRAGGSLGCVASSVVELSWLHSLRSRAQPAPIAAGPLCVP